MEFFNYKAKYSPNIAKHILPAKITKKAYEICKEYAKIAHDTINCRGLSRSDFIYYEDKIYFIEINTQPGLTALSLLFAVFLSNPAPICVLDEVDAPLDDTNVDRFCSLVEEISKSSLTKFLVITHHRMTMARVNRLFGVTMPEQGISQLVSVDLEKAVSLREIEDE